MAIYTVHEPPPKRRPRRRGPDHFRFVRDGFHFWAFAAAPLWLLWRRLWLALIGYVVVAAAMALALRMAGVPTSGILLAQLLLSLLIGLEAGSLTRWTLRRRKWRELGLVSARSQEEAERRFFEAWVEGETGLRSPPDAAEAAPNGPPPRRPPPPSAASPGIVGLFPEPGAPGGLR